jgi:HTH-type transcriptional regulator / antitoxin HigA
MNKARAAYKALTDRFPLRPIRSDAELNAAHKVAEPLFLRVDRLTIGEQEYLQVLSMLIHEYEEKFHAFPGKGSSAA